MPYFFSLKFPPRPTPPVEDTKTAEKLVKLQDRLSFDGAFVYLMQDETQMDTLRASIKSLYENFLDFTYPQYRVVIFIDEIYPYMELETEFPFVQFDFFRIDPREMQTNHLERMWRLENPNAMGEFEHAEKRATYRYSAGFLLTHPGLAMYKTLMLMDPTAISNYPWAANPIQEMDGKIVGYVGTRTDLQATTELASFVQQFALDNNRTLTFPSLAFTPEGLSNGKMFNWLCVAVNTNAFQSDLYKRFFSYLDATEGFIRYDWDDNALLLMFASLIATPNQVEFMDYVFVSHKS